jgi:hypothetical protein
MTELTLFIIFSLKHYLSLLFKQRIHRQSFLHQTARIFVIYGSKCRD